MSPEDVIALMAVLTAAVLITLGLPLVKAWARRRELGQHAAPAPESEERLRRMEAAIESIAVEVERISENQRFVTRLLAERAPAAAQAGDRELPAGAPPARDHA